MWFVAFVNWSDFTKPISYLYAHIPVQLGQWRMICVVSAEVAVCDGDQVVGRVEVGKQLQLQGKFHTFPH